MGTRASIRFKDDYDTFYVYRGHDGYPDGDILPDLRKAVEQRKRDPYSYGDVAQLLSVFFGVTYDPGVRLQRYEITTSIHGDESYHYFVVWNTETKTFDIGYDEEPDEPDRNKTG